MFHLKDRQGKQILRSSAFGLQNEDQPLGKDDQRASLSLLIQMLISSGSTLTDNIQNNVKPSLWTPRGPVKLTHKISRRKVIVASNLRATSRSYGLVCVDHVFYCPQHTPSAILMPILPEILTWTSCSQGIGSIS